MKRVMLTGLLLASGATISPMLQKGKHDFKEAAPAGVGAGLALCADRASGTQLPKDAGKIRRGVHTGLQVTNLTGGAMTGVALDPRSGWMPDKTRAVGALLGTVVSASSIAARKVNNGTWLASWTGIKPPTV